MKVYVFVKYHWDSLGEVKVFSPKNISSCVIDYFPFDCPPDVQLRVSQCAFRQNAKDLSLARCGIRFWTSLFMSFFQCASCDMTSHSLSVIPTPTPGMEVGVLCEQHASGGRSTTPRMWSGSPCLLSPPRIHWFQMSSFGPDSPRFAWTDPSPDGTGLYKWPSSLSETYLAHISWRWSVSRPAPFDSWRSAPFYPVKDFMPPPGESHSRNRCHLNQRLAVPLESKTLGVQQILSFPRF